MAHCRRKLNARPLQGEGFEASTLVERSAEPVLVEVGLRSLLGVP